MYLHIGKDIVINKKDIIAILDLKSIEENKENKEWLKKIKDEENIIDISGGIQKTLVLEVSNIYITNISSNTLYKRKI